MSDPEALGAQIDDIKNKLNIVNEDLAALSVMEQRSAEAYKKYCEIESNTAVIKHRLSSVPDSVKTLQISDEDIQKVSEYKANEVNNQLADLSDKLQETRSTLAALDATLKASNTVTEDAKAKAIADHNKRRQLESDIIEAKVLIDNLTKSLESTVNINAKLKEDKEKAEQVNFKREVLTVARQALGRDYLPRLLMENIITKLNTHLLYYINLFNFKYNCKVLADGNFYYLNESNDWVNTRYLSGGQKYIVALMLKLAMAATIRTNFPFYVLDEPTTGLDYKNRALLADLFKDMEANLKPLYLIIPTHDSEVAEVATNKIIIGE
jgi:DNA repair exonuclease SbcCD ATPase subunit